MPSTAEMILGDCRQVLKTFESESFDSMVTDPPAGISFMGSEWDTHTLDGFENFLTEVFLEVYRVLKPGSHILVWSIPRTSHRTACAIERAGFVIRDGLDNIKDRSAEVQAFLDSLTQDQVEMLLRAGPADSFILHVFGSGFPKSLNVSKAIDKMRGAERKVIGTKVRPDGTTRDQSTWGSKVAVCYAQDEWTKAHGREGNEETEPATSEAAQWDGFGTALKPAIETWWLARKPLHEKTVVEQVLATGTGALNIDGCRVAGDMSELINPGTGKPRSGMGSHYNDEGGFGGAAANPPHIDGRWPANVTLQHGPGCTEVGDTWECATGCPVREFGFTDLGGASRFFNQFEPDLEAAPFFYTSKISSSERKEDLEEEGLINDHPTVKSKKLMRHLVRLVTPPEGRVLDPFAGSGSTIVAALEESFSGVGIEQDERFHSIASRRIDRSLERELVTQSMVEAFDLMLNLESE